MDSKRKPSINIALFLSINLIFCALTAHATRTNRPPSNNPSTGSPSNNPSTSPPSNNPSTGPPSNNPSTGPPSNNPNNPPSNPTSPPSNPTSPPSNNLTCPRDALQLAVCANVLGNLLGIVIGNPPVQPCCSLIQGLVDLEAAVCLCTVIRATLLGINLNIPLSLSLLLNVCGRNPPSGFTCN